MLLPVSSQFSISFSFGQNRIEIALYTDDIKKNIEQLSSEDVINIAKDKVDLVKEKLSDMTSYVKKKSVPIIRDAVNNLLDKLDEAQSNVEN